MDVMKRLRNQKGVTIIAVFFVLLILGAMGMAVSKLTQSQQLQSAKAIQVQTAYYNARSGLEWAYQRCTELLLAVCNDGDFSALNPGVLQTYAINGKILEFTLSFNGNALTSTATVGDGERSITFATFGDNFPAGGEEPPPDDTQPPIGGGESGDGADSCSGSLDFSTTPFPGDQNYDDSGYSDFPEYVPATDNLGVVDLTGHESLTLGSGTYLMTSLKTAGNATLTITGPALIYVDGTTGTPSVDLSGNGIKTIGNNVKFVIIGDFDAGGNASINSTPPAELDITASGTVTFGANTGFTCP